MVKIKIFLGYDHQGLKCKNNVVNYLEENGFNVSTTKLENNDFDDYPDFAYEICENVLKEKGLGILICGTGIGMSIAANKIKGIRCARVVSGDDAFLARNHNGANVIAFSCNLNKSQIQNIIDNFVATKDPNEERHLRRIEKVKQIEEGTYRA